MVQFIPRPKGFGELMAEGIGQGASQGMQQMQQMMMQAAMEKQKQKRLQTLLTPSSQEQTGNQLSGQNQPERIKFSNLSPEKKVGLYQEFPEVARGLQKEEELGLREKKFEYEKDIKREEAADRSYESQKEFINKTTNAYQSYESELKPKLMQMQKLNQDELIGPASAKFLETIGIPLGVLENPSNELYDKVSQDLLKGLPETYGNKILLAEVQNFLKTIPRLVNSADGRRMIASNMLKLGEMKQVLYNEMRRQQTDILDKGGKFPKDFQQRVFDNVKPQIDRINREFLQLADIKSVPPNTTPYFNSQGGITFVPNQPENFEWASQNGWRQIW